MGKQNQKPAIRSNTPQPAAAVPMKGRFFSSPLGKFILVLIAVCFIVYGNTLNNGFVLDDSAVIQQNAFVVKGISAIPTLLVTPYHQGFMRANNLDTAGVNDLYRPLSMVAFAVEQQFFDSSPAPWHFVNILFFAACVVLLFLFLDRLFGRKHMAASFVAALLFAVHPMHTEVVANIKSLDELLCFFFAFWGLLLFHNYAESGRNKLLIAGAVCYFLSLLSKETSASFLVVIPLIFFFYKNENRKRSAYITASSVAATVIYLAIRFFVLKAYHADSTSNIVFIDNEFSGAPSFGARIATIILVLGRYAKLLFIPFPLSSDYAFSTIPFVTFASPLVWATILFYLGIKLSAIFRFIKFRKDPYAFGVLFFLITIAMFANVFFLIGATMADRFLFFPSVGFCIAVSFALFGRISKMSDPIAPSLLPKRIWLFVAPVVIIFGLLSVYRNAEWKDNETLFTTDLSRFPQNARLWHSVGSELLASVSGEQTDSIKRKGAQLEAVHYFKNSISIYPGDFKIHNDLGNLYVKLKYFDTAETEMKQAIKLAPSNPVPVSDLGAIYFQEQKYPLAIRLSEQSLAMTPQNTGVMDNLIVCYLTTKQYDSAIIMANNTLKVDADNQLAKQVIAQQDQLKARMDTLKK